MTHGLNEVMNTNCLSNWFPKIQAAGLPVPKTEIVKMPSDVPENIYKVFDGEQMGKPAVHWLENDLRHAAERIRYPCFLRTGQTSGKHQWKNTCYVDSPSSLPSHVIAIIEFSECCDMIGLPWDVWAVREFLPTFPQMIADIYGNMPVCREFRYFVRDGEIECVHPYWPDKALRDGISELPRDFNERYKLLCKVPDDSWDTLRDLATRAGAAVGGYWSVDILETKKGWYVTDMAVGDRSWHWPECEHAKGDG